MRNALLLLSLPVALAAQGTPKPKAKPAPAVKQEAPAPAPVPVVKPRIQMDTTLGPIVLELEPALAPKTVANFLQYVKGGHYTGTIFHRVIKGFMIQGGGHLEDLTEKPTRAPIPNEAGDALKGGLRNARGTISMARTGDPHSATAQFFINTVDNTALDHTATTSAGYDYCPFGRVVSGMETVDKIEASRTGWKRGMQNVPEYAITIKGVKVLP